MQFVVRPAEVILVTKADRQVVPRRWRGRRPLDYPNAWIRDRATHFPRENVTKPSRFGIFTFCSVCASIVSPSAMMPLRFKI